MVLVLDEQVCPDHGIQGRIPAHGRRLEVGGDYPAGVEHIAKLRGLV